MHFNPQLFKISIIQTKLFGPLDFELSRFHCTGLNILVFFFFLSLCLYIFKKYKRKENLRADLGKSTGGATDLSKF